jgi:hypothetical protein
MKSVVTHFWSRTKKNKNTKYKIQNYKLQENQENILKK